MASRDSGSRHKRDRGDRPKGSKEPATPEAEPDERSELETEDLERSESGIRGKLESMVPDIVKKAMISGIGALFVTEETIRSAVADMRLPKEAVNFLTQQADNTKDQLFRHIARELREFLETADMAEELPKLLANMTIEVKSEIRFIPKIDAIKDDDDDAVEPEVSSDIAIKTRRSRDK